MDNIKDGIEFLNDYNHLLIEKIKAKSQMHKSNTDAYQNIMDQQKTFHNDLLEMQNKFAMAEINIFKKIQETIK